MLASGCSSDGDGGGTNKKQYVDERYTPDSAMSIHAKDPERALLIIDSAVIVGNISEGLASMLRAKIMCQTFAISELDSAKHILEELIESDFVEESDNNKEVVLDLLVNVSRQQNDNASYLRWATEKATFCRERGLETEALRTDAEIGVVFAMLGEEERGLAKLNGVIAALDGRRHFNEMDACIIAIKRKISVLSFLNKPAEIVPLAKRIVEILKDYGAHPEVYADSSYRVPSDDKNREDYIIFYTSQAQGILAKAYADLDMKDSSHHYLALFEPTEYAKTFNGMTKKGSIYYKLGDYGKMLAIYNELEPKMGSDTLDSDYAEMLYGRACAAEYYGNFRAAIGYLHRYNNLIQLLNRQLLESRAFDYAARYNLKEEQMKLESEQRKGEKTRNLLIGAFLLAMVSIGAVVWLRIQQMSIKRKNNILAEQIAEATKIRLENEHLKTDAEAGTEEKQAPKELDPQAISNFTEEELFTYLSSIIRSEKLFTDPNFGRQTLADRFHLSDHRIGAAFARGSEHNSLPDFIRELRLEYACQMLSENPDMSINNIATACGFNSATVFCRYFKNKFDVTPTFFRSQLEEK